MTQGKTRLDTVTQDKTQSPKTRTEKTRQGLTSEGKSTQRRQDKERQHKESMAGKSFGWENRAQKQCDALGCVFGLSFVLSCLEMEVVAQPHHKQPQTFPRSPRTFASWSAHIDKISSTNESETKINQQKLTRQIYIYFYDITSKPHLGLRSCVVLVFRGEGGGGGLSLFTLGFCFFVF
jgi:hypothetical protein